MRIKLTKPWANPSGRILPVGQEVIVTNDLGRELCTEGIAKPVLHMNAFYEDEGAGTPEIENTSSKTKKEKRNT